MHRSDQARHQASVRASAESALSTRGLSSDEGCQLITKCSRDPSTAVNSATAAPSATATSRGVLTWKLSGPAVTSTPSETSSTQGVIDP